MIMKCDMLQMKHTKQLLALLCSHYFCTLSHVLLRQIFQSWAGIEHPQIGGGVDESHMQTLKIQDASSTTTF